MKKILKPKFSRIIKWSKWVDRYPTSIPEEELEPSQFENYEDRYDVYDQDHEHDHTELQGVPEKVILTDFGFIKVQPFSNALSAFNLWQGDTNFNLSEDVLMTINRTEGIEELTPYSRYKFRIGVGACFNFQDVRQSVEKNLNAIPKKLTVK